jgi:hypothetical protein
MAESRLKATSQPRHAKNSQRRKKEHRPPVKSLPEEDISSAGVLSDRNIDSGIIFL